MRQYAAMASVIAVWHFAAPVMAANIVTDSGFEAWGTSGSTSVWSQNRGIGCSYPLLSTYAAHRGLLRSHSAMAVQISTRSPRTLSTQPGATYDVSFWVNVLVDPNQDQEAYYLPEFRAYWGDTQVADLLVTGDWEYHSYTLTAANSVTTIAFAGTNLLAATEVDDISVELHPTDIPEPSIGALAFGSLAARAGLRRRHQVH